jgi:hypothetical protein
MRHRRGAAVLGALALALVGCTADIDSGASDLIVTTQVRFDFTVVADRALFAEHGLEHRGSVGPYAVYEVTAEDARLEGPRVRFDRTAHGLIMLCGANGYFAPEGSSAEPTSLTLLGGAEGEDELTQSRVQALTYDDCSEPEDAFTERPESEETPEMAELFITHGERIVLRLDPTPALGSLVLVRMLSVAEPERNHNDSPVTPSVCCDGDLCVLD